MPNLMHAEGCQLSMSVILYLVEEEAESSHNKSEVYS